MNMAKGKYQQWLTPEGLLKISGWAKDGLIDQQIADNMGINVKTLYEWKNNYSNISNALKESKDTADRQVENAMFKSAVGFEYDEETFETIHLRSTITDPDTGDEKEVIYESKEVLVKRVKKVVAPNTTAGIFWLKNRKPEVWRDRIENAIITPEPIKMQMDLSKISTDELKKLVEITDKVIK